MATITTTKIPFSADPIELPGGGLENWNGQDYANFPTAANRQQREDYYFRFSWTQLENADGTFNPTKFDTEIRKAINAGQKFNIGGVMTVSPGGADSFNGPVTYDGSSSLYPLHIHQKMQQESVKDRIIGGTWIPNWNSNVYLSGMERVLNNLAAHIENTSYNGKRYKDVVGYIDIRFMGSWGEWHHASIVDPVTNYPAGMKPTVATYKRIIDAHISAFQDFPLVILFAAYDRMFFNNTQVPAEVTWYALTRANRWGKIGYRRDQWGSSQWNSQDNYVHAYLDNNNGSFGDSGPFKNTIMERWKESPVVGEPENNGEALPALVPQVQMYHASMIGNGNYSRSTTADNNMRLAGKYAGYRLTIEGGSQTITTNQAIISLNWKNEGLAPTYEKWDTIFELRNSSGTIVWSGLSAFKAFRFIPQTSATTVTDTFSGITQLSAGTYELTVKLVDPNDYRKPMPLFLQGRKSDGSYSLGNVLVTGGGTPVNQPPTANAGIDQTIKLPINRVTLSATAIDNDGNIVSGLWTRASGSGTIVNPSSMTTDVTGLTQGTSVFRFTATDNQGATGSDTVSIIVNAASVNILPVANAGPDSTIKAPANSTTLQGTATDADGTIVSTVWTKIGGPSGGTLSTPSSLTTNITGLVPGTYTYRLVVTDNSGGVAADNVSVIVQPADVEPPVPVKTIKSVTVNYSDNTSVVVV